MPELPEVETVRLGLVPTLVNQTITQIIVRNPKLRWTVSSDLAKTLPGLKVLDIQRRGKYLLFKTRLGELILHLGMSGRVQLLAEPPAPQRHDHVDIIFSNGITLRYTDPRRFGCLIWTEQPAEQHKLLAHLGVEPLSQKFSARYLYEQAVKRKLPVKLLLMNHQVVVGLGNIYANEALFEAGVHPLTPAKSLTLSQCQRLVKVCKKVLARAIKAGGTTLKDYKNAQGQSGYFSQKLNVYGKAGFPCKICGALLVGITVSNRATVFCPQCQA